MDGWCRIVIWTTRTGSGKASTEYIEAAMRVPTENPSWQIIIYSGLKLVRLRATTMTNLCHLQVIF